MRPFLKLLSKAKAAKLVRGLVDMFLDMEREPSGQAEVQLCKVKLNMQYRDGPTFFLFLMIPKIKATAISWRFVRSFLCLGIGLLLLAFIYLMIS